MDASQIIMFARKLCKGVSASQISDVEMETVLNKAYKDFYKKIVDLDKNYFWDRRTADVVNAQYEYSLTQPTSTTYGMFKPEKIRIKYTTTGDFKDITFTERDNLVEIPEYYASSQSTDEPFCIMTDRKYVHIFPTPTEDITGGLIFEGAKKPYDLTVDSAEWDICIDPLYHEALAYMMVPIIEKTKGNIDEKNDAIAEADRELRNALKSMGVLTTKAIRGIRPNLADFE